MLAVTRTARASATIATSAACCVPDDQTCSTRALNALHEKRDHKATAMAALRTAARAEGHAPSTTALSALREVRDQKPPVVPALRAVGAEKHTAAEPTALRTVIDQARHRRKHGFERLEAVKTANRTNAPQPRSRVTSPRRREPSRVHAARSVTEAHHEHW
jgi:hypothetical protein